MNYTNSEKYQQEIAEQYSKRVSKFPKEEVAQTLGKLGFEITAADLKEAHAGNMNATYIAPKIVVKVSRDRDKINFFANTIISDRLSDCQPVVKVLAYDYFRKTGFEMVVMERARGTLLLDDIFN